MKTTQFNCWLWPDRTISKKESRILREEHNALVNELSALNAIKIATQKYGQATPRPWKFTDEGSGWGLITDVRGNIIANVNSETGPGDSKMPVNDNAAIIVQAVNEYDALCAVAAAADEFIVNASSQAARFDLLWAVKKLVELREGKAG